MTGKAIFWTIFSTPHAVRKDQKKPLSSCQNPFHRHIRAEALPGVRAVITHKNMPEQLGLGLPVHRLLMEDKVYYVGIWWLYDCSRYSGDLEVAIDLIDVEYEQLEAVYTAEDALKEGAVEIYSRFKGITLTTESSISSRTVPGGRLSAGMWRRDLKKQPMWRKTRWPLTKCLRPWPRNPVLHRQI